MLFFLLSIPVNVRADIYRCKDTNGVWYLTNSPSEDTRCERYIKTPSTSVGKPSPEIQHCEEAYNAKHWKDAAKWCPIAAKQGNASAQFYLGVMYAHGQGVKQNYAESVKWYSKAAQHGDGDAQCNLGRLYITGEGVPQDFTKAFEWYRKAAEQGFADAQYNLAVHYFVTQRTPEDLKKAIKWLHKAAEQGFAPAQYNLGVLYNQGSVVPRNTNKAVEWFGKAAKQGFAEAQFYLGLAYAYGAGGLQKSGATASDLFYKAGLNYLKNGEREKSLACVEKIKELKSKFHLKVPNYFLAEELSKKIYGGN